MKHSAAANDTCFRFICADGGATLRLLAAPTATNTVATISALAQYWTVLWAVPTACQPSPQVLQSRSDRIREKRRVFSSHVISTCFVKRVFSSQSWHVHCVCLISNLMHAFWNTNGAYFSGQSTATISSLRMEIPRSYHSAQKTSPCNRCCGWYRRR